MTYYLDPYGCVKNQVDAENMMAFLNKAGWAAAEHAENADLIIVNSCGFIESAKMESLGAVLAWRKLFPEKKIILSGCLAQRYPKELAVELTEADYYIGTEDISSVVEAAEKICGITHNGTPEINPGSRPLLSLPGSAYVKISEGCDNRCSYCAIPLIRGSQRSRSVKDIIRECKALLRRGIRELCLVGQDTGAYGRDGKGDLPDLLEAISGLKGAFWVRLLYLHPDHFPLSILDIMEKDRRFIPYFDIPFQHSSEKILRLMNRRGNAKIYLDLIKTLRRRLPDAVIRSTFMTGFPGETDDDFRQLLSFQKKARLDWMGAFAYSREENTPAWNMKGRVPKKTAARRKDIIEEAQIPITEKQMDRFIGRSFDVLVEEKMESPGEELSGDSENSGEDTVYLGRLPMQAPDIDGSTVIFSPRQLSLGEIIRCRIISRSGFDLRAIIEN